MAFIDELKVHIKAGSGGDGVVRGRVHVQGDDADQDEEEDLQDPAPAREGGPHMRAATLLSDPIVAEVRDSDDDAQLAVDDDGSDVSASEGEVVGEQAADGRQAHPSRVIQAQYDDGGVYKTRQLGDDPEGDEEPALHLTSAADSLFKPMHRNDAELRVYGYLVVALRLEKER